MQTVAIGKIIEGALSGDKDKVKSYGEHIAKQLEKDGDDLGAKILRDKINGVKSENIVVLDSEVE